MSMISVVSNACVETCMQLGIRTTSKTYGCILVGIQTVVAQKVKSLNDTSLRLILSLRLHPVYLISRFNYLRDRDAFDLMSCSDSHNILFLQVLLPRPLFSTQAATR